MSLRVIAGEWRGRKLQAPAGTATRPLLGRIKQSLFDRLGQDLSGQTVADVCAGSGSFGIEAASRGAVRVHLIESGSPAIACLRHNLAQLGNPAALQLHPRPFQQVLPQLQNLDLIYADPPFPWYRDEPALLAQLLERAAPALAAAGRLLIRGEAGQRLPPCPKGLQLQDEWAYGRSWIAVLQPAA